ncbi:MAG: hypothetical protein NUV74_09720 [Candidatus Brocadiaceae bacterium]|nr:hypothetical protein [Candidatus Brocadiaceae bacterium]
MSISENATKLLQFLADYQKKPDDPQKGLYQLQGEELATKTRLSPVALNDAVSMLEDNDYVQVIKWLGTVPFAFGQVGLTSRGRYEAESLAASANSTPYPSATNQAPSLSRSVTPVGSPYGFTDHDWASVAVDRGDSQRIIVSFGYQWKSQHYNTADLESNVEAMFRNALNAAAAKLQISVALDFRKLQGGYGTHLFNEITRDIIGSDIAAFDTSDQNPNVMIELGVALTWGVRILPIREQLSPKPPSDISGHTWAEYTNSAQSWQDAYHQEKLKKMMEFAIKRKCP